MAFIGGVCANRTLYKNKWLGRYELREGTVSKRYIYKDRWLNRLVIKDVVTKKPIECWRYNRWLKRFESKRRK